MSAWTTLSVLPALLALFGLIFRGRQLLPVSVLGRQPQVAVSKHTVHRPRLHQQERLCGSRLSRLCAGRGERSVCPDHLWFPKIHVR
jgi:hypothetical protein